MLDYDTIHRHLAETTDLVQRLADRVQRIEDTVGNCGSGSATLAAASDSLAGQARNAASAIDRCLLLAARNADPGVDEAVAWAGYTLAEKWTVTLQRTLDAAVTVFRQACEALADCVAIVEEHHVPPAAGQGLAASLAEHARALTQDTRTTH